MHRASFSMFFAACLLVPAWPDIAVSAVVPGTFVFEYSEGRCSLSANEAPLTEVFEAIQAQIGVPVEFDSDDPATTTQNLTDVDLERLMKLLAENVVMTYVVDPEAPDGYRIERIVTDPAADAAARERAEARRMPPIPGEVDPSGPVRSVRYSGVGAAIRMSTDQEGIILQPNTPDAPVVKAGIEPDDVIVAIDGKPITSFASLVEIANAIRGPEGTAITLTVRAPNGAHLPRRVVRERIEYHRPIGRRGR